MHGPDFLDTIQYMLLKDTFHIRNKRELKNRYQKKGSLKGKTVGLPLVGTPIQLR